MPKPSVCSYKNGTIAYRSTFRIIYLVGPFFGTERFYLKCSRLNAALQRSTFRNDTERSGMIAFSSEQDLSGKMYKQSCYFLVLRDTIEHGRDIDSVLSQYTRLVKPAFEDFTLPVRKVSISFFPLILLLPCCICFSCTLITINDRTTTQCRITTPIRITALGEEQDLVISAPDE